jgi:hypothetical protein
VSDGPLAQVVNTEWGVFNSAFNRRVVGFGAEWSAAGVGVLVGLDWKVWVALGVGVGGGSAVGEVLVCVCCMGVIGSERYVVLNRVKHKTSHPNQIVCAHSLPSSPPHPESLSKS